eukprot:COSAG02_NODE_1394_length_12906_cov_3.129304_12_plen_62_part_00
MGQRPYSGNEKPIGLAECGFGIKTSAWFGLACVYGCFKQALALQGDCVLILCNLLHLFECR